MFRNDKGSFTKLVTPYDSVIGADFGDFSNNLVSRSVLMLKIDLDGNLDLIMYTRDFKITLYINDVLIYYL